MRTSITTSQPPPSPSPPSPSPPGQPAPPSRLPARPGRGPAATWVWPTGKTSAARPPRRRLAIEGGGMPGIVVGIDGSVHARAALDWAMREAAFRQTPLHVLTVSPAMHSPWSGRALTMPAESTAVQQARQSAERAVAENNDKLGDARPESVTVASFIGSRGAGGFESLLLASISNQVVHHAACPVVVVPIGR